MIKIKKQAHRQDIISRSRITYNVMKRHVLLLADLKLHI